LVVQNPQAVRVRNATLRCGKKGTDCTDWQRRTNPVDPLDLSHIEFIPSGFSDDHGDPVLRNSCAFFNNWNADNLGSVPFSQP
jgi:hypothetical protein